MIEQHQMDQQDLHIVFIELEKAYVEVSKEILWKVLEKKMAKIAYIRVTQNMYEGYQLVCIHREKRHKIFLLQ